jgi:hypothetical protein
MSCAELVRPVRRAAGSAAAAPAPPIVRAVLARPGRPLDPPIRESMEKGLGHDFGRVRVHDDAFAAESVRTVGAVAYSVGRDVVFDTGRFDPSTASGRSLLAHELAHVAQQDGSDAGRAPELRLGRADDPAEREAERAAAEVARGRTTRVRPRPERATIRRQAAPTGIRLAEIKPFGHGDLKSDASKQKFRTCLGATTLMQATPAGDYKGHCAKEHLTEVANTCPARFKELMPKGFCTGDRCLDFNRGASMGDAETGKMVTDGPDTFIDLHRIRGDQSLLEGTGKNACTVVCHQRYQFDRKTDLGSFFIVRNFRAGTYKAPGAKASVHITTGEIQKVPAGLKAPSAESFAKDIAPGLKKSGVLAEAPPLPQAPKKDAK